MALTLASAFKPVANQYLSALSAVLEKAKGYAAEKSIAETVLLQSRLYPDMLPMVKQVQIACDMCARGSARLTNQELPTFADDETSFEDLQNRISKVLDQLASISDEDLNAGAERDVTVPTGPDSSITMNGTLFLVHFLLPNMYFHITTAYGLLRHNGVPIGKRDFLGQLPI